MPRMLFSHFWYDEILLTFENVSDFLDQVIQNYPSFCLRIDSNNWINLDRVLRRFRFDQFTSLVLLDDHHLPSDTFVRYPISHFNALRHVVMKDVCYDSCKAIYSQLGSLPHLRSFSFESSKMTHRYPAWRNDYEVEPNLWASLQRDCAAIVFPRLRSLHVDTPLTLANVPFTHLRRLSMGDCTADTFVELLGRTPQLQIWRGTLDIVNWNDLRVIPVNHLHSLALSFHSLRNSSYSI
jgi:hypothetical protein